VRSKKDLTEPTLLEMPGNALQVLHRPSELARLIGKLTDYPKLTSAPILWNHRRRT